MPFFPVSSWSKACSGAFEPVVVVDPSTRPWKVFAKSIVSADRLGPFGAELSSAQKSIPIGQVRASVFGARLQIGDPGFEKVGVKSFPTGEFIRSLASGNLPRSKRRRRSGRSRSPERRRVGRTRPGETRDFAFLGPDRRLGLVVSLDLLVGNGGASSYPVLAKTPASA